MNVNTRRPMLHRTLKPGFVKDIVVGSLAALSALIASTFSDDLPSLDCPPAPRPLTRSTNHVIYNNLYYGRIWRRLVFCLSTFWCGVQVAIQYVPEMIQVASKMTQGHCRMLFTIPRVQRLGRYSSAIRFGHLFDIHPNTLHRRHNSLFSDLFNMTVTLK